ncbi:MAG: hypothetical protein EAZ16_07825 [Sphingobacteriales bacterium]|nr:MAG: hypothetical protein EAZ16_07825 [Sphingobacteriales bacterium]
MKKIALIALIIFSSVCLYGQEANGYYINKSGDTVRGKIEIPTKRNLLIVGSSRTGMGQAPKIEADPLFNDSIKESKKINYSKLTFDFKFAETEGKFKKIDRLKIKGFGFFYEEHQYDFIVWDVSENKQLYLIPATGDVVPDGVYFILNSITGYFKIYSLFQEVELLKQSWDNRPDPGIPAIKKEYYKDATKRDIIFKHPTKGYIYISDQYPLKMKFAEALKYLELEDEFIKTLKKTDLLLDVIKKYNLWKASK